MRTLDVGPRIAARVPDAFDVRPDDRFGLRALAPTIGAEITGVDLAAPLDGELLAEIRRALLERKVLFFRDQDVTREQHRGFAARWGELEQHPSTGSSTRASPTSTWSGWPRTPSRAASRTSGTPTSPGIRTRRSAPF